MSKDTLKLVMLGGSTVAGGALGSWAGARLGATYGLRLGPWGAVSGAVLGAVAGIVLSNTVLNEYQENAELTPPE